MSGSCTWSTRKKNTMLVVDSYGTMVGTLLTFTSVQMKILCKIMASVNKYDSELTICVRMLNKRGDVVFVKKVAVRDGSASFPWRRVVLHSDKDKGLAAVLPALNYGSAMGYSYTRVKSEPILKRINFGQIEPSLLESVDFISIELSPPGK